jgi:hypothetical protein
MIAQRLVFTTCPADQRLADVPLDGPGRRRIETTVVVEPPAKLGVDFLGEFCDGLFARGAPRTQVLVRIECFARECSPYR